MCIMKESSYHFHRKIIRPADGTAARILDRPWAAMAMMPWLWGGAAKEKYSHEDLYFSA